MENIFQTILNYLLFILKLVGVSILFSIPFFIIVKIFKSKFINLRKKFSVIGSLFIIIYIISYIILLLIYFLPIISTFYQDLTFWQSVGFIFYHLIRLILINIIISGVILSFSFITLAIYDKSETNKKKPYHNLNLFKSLIITNIIIFFILLVFPKLIALLVYLIYI
ncbi:hypothetical protein GW835_02070 [archaeon]|nr:hypothetical protein [archaeon]NCP79332.1 hypothetical protein [archaeon]NCP97275.1 hypothetical protein [archaeon]NCQ07099.1 hypothetical protein [archaeon]NCQ50895.1 hypothetical protein [archaeon]